MTSYTAFITEHKTNADGSSEIRSQRKVEVTAPMESVARKIIMSFHVDFRFDNVVDIQPMSKAY